jgi:LysM repeat protein
LVVLVALLGKRALNGNASLRQFAPIAQANLSAEATPTSLAVTLPPFVTPDTLPGAISRQIDPQTIIPGRPRSDVITYTVKPGDNLFSIAEVFNLKPETLLWGNYDSLKDNPEILQPEQVLNVLPVDGTYYQWQEGDTLNRVAASFKAKAEDIMAYPGNQIDLTTPVTATDAIEPGRWVIIPGGSRPLKDWGPPAISRSSRATTAQGRGRGL